jgi:peptide subunit release factor 1 (eRF1)
MAEQQLSIRSTRARNLAHMLAKKEQRTVSQIVERALDAYVNKPAVEPKESAAEFWERVRRDHGTEHNLEEILEEHRTPHVGMEL